MYSVSSARNLAVTLAGASLHPQHLVSCQVLLLNSLCIFLHLIASVLFHFLLIPSMNCVTDIEG